jgi:hypothetical protein
LTDVNGKSFTHVVCWGCKKDAFERRYCFCCLTSGRAAS